MQPLLFRQKRKLNKSSPLRTISDPLNVVFIQQSSKEDHFQSNQDFPLKDLILGKLIFNPTLILTN